MRPLPMARLALLFLACFSRSIHALRVVQLALGDGQALAQAVADFGASGEDTTIYLPRGKVFSLANVSIVDVVQTNPDVRPFSSGVLTIMPAPGDDLNPTVLDTAMLGGIASINGRPAVFQGTAELHITNLVVVNMCDHFVNLNMDGSLGWDSAISFFLFVQTRARRSHLFTNATLYLRPADLSSFAYLLVLTWTTGWYHPGPPPFTKFVAVTSELLADTPRAPLSNNFRLATSYSASTTLTHLAAAVLVNTTFTSLADPLDPLMQTLRDSGALLAPRYCFKPGAPTPRPLNPDLPLWMVSDTRGWLAAVQSALTASASSQVRRPPIVFLVGSALPAATSPVQQLPGLLGMLLLSGWFSDQPDIYKQESMLDFSNSLAFQLPVLTSGSLFIQHMTLKGLAAYPQPRSPTPSALPLAVFPRAAGSDPVLMDTVTLELPELDYMALMALAQPSLTAAFNTTVRRHAEALKQGISVLSLAQLSPGYSQMVLSAFSGWGINATNLNLVPANPDTVSAGMLLAVRGQTCSGSGLSTQQVGIIAGCSVAGLVVVCGAVLLAGLLSSRSTRRYEESTVEAAASKLPPPPAAMDKSGVTSATTCTDVEEHAAATVTATARAANVKVPVLFSANREQDGYPYNGAPIYVPVEVPGADTDIQAAHPTSCFSFAPPAAQINLDASAPAAPVPAASKSAASSLFPLTIWLGMSRAEEAGIQQHARALEPDDLKELAGFCGEQSLLSQKGAPEGDTDKVLVRLPHRDNATASTLSVTAAGTELEGPLDSAPLPAGQQRTTQSLDCTAGNTSGCGTMSSDPKKAVAELVQEMTRDRSNVVSIHGVLGQGSWGTVYSGEWRGLPVAIKTMLFEVVEEPQGASVTTGLLQHDQAILEAAVAASVDHPNVVHTYYYDIQTIDSSNNIAVTAAGLQIHDASHDIIPSKTYKLFLVQELCAATLDCLLEKGVLRDKITGMENLPQTIMSLLLDIASGLQYLHSRNIVHGDLKPANVLLKAGSAPTTLLAKLADFGLSARLVGGRTHISNYARGTPFYVAPEVIQEHRTSPAADVFSFGVIMWQCHTGTTPYVREANGQFAWNAHFPKYLPQNPPTAAYAELANRCLLRNPRSRPSAAQLVNALQQMATAPAGLPSGSAASSRPQPHTS